MKYAPSSTHVPEEQSGTAAETDHELVEQPTGTAHVPTLHPQPSPLDHHPPVPNDHHDPVYGEHHVGVDQHERGAHQLFPQPTFHPHEGEHHEFHEPKPIDTLQLLPLEQLFQFEPHQFELLFQLQFPPPPFQFPPPPPPPLQLPPPPPPFHEDALADMRFRPRTVRSSNCAPAIPLDGGASAAYEPPPRTRPLPFPPPPPPPPPKPPRV